MKVWMEKPVSEPPEKNGWYYCTNSNGEILMSMVYCADKDWRTITEITHYLVPKEVDHVLTDNELEEEKESFALSFAVWAMFDPDAKALQAAGASAGKLMDRYKSRPYIDYNNASNQ